MPDTAQLKEAIHTLTGILQKQKDLGKSGTLLSDKHLKLLIDLPKQFSHLNTPSAPSTKREVTSSPLTDTSTAEAIEVPDRGIEKLVLEGENKRERLNYIARLVKMDAKLQTLGTLRETMVFATGNPDAKLMLIGEAPGAEEENQRKPFVGPAGQLLDKILEAMGLNRKDVYISNIVKFRPQVTGTGNPITGNRKPHREEIDSCLKYVMAEIDVVKPSVIIALGGTAADGLLGGQTPVGKLREQSHTLKGIPLVITYHPSYLLHCESSYPGKLKEEKGKVWADMKSALEKLNLPSQR